MKAKVFRRYLISASDYAAKITIILLLFGWMQAAASADQLSLSGTLISDSAGRRIVVTKPFQRIISLYGAHTENLFYMSARNQVVGMTRHEDWPAAVSAKTVFSYHDDLEKFLVARPDLVIIRPMIDRGYRRLMAQLEGRGIVVVSLQPGTVAEMFVYWRILGLLTGCAAGADAMVSEFQHSIDEISRLTAALPTKKRVYFEAIHDRMRTFAPGAMPLFVLETAGGINVAADAVARRGTNIADYGKEHILAHAEDIDIYLAQVGPMNQPTFAAIKAEPGYELIRAVRNDQIFLIDEKLVARPTMRMLAGIRDIGRMLYPQLFQHEAKAMEGHAIRGSFGAKSIK